MKKAKIIINVSLALAIIAIFGWYIYSNWNDFSELSIMHPWALILAPIFILISLASSGKVNELTMEPHGVKPTLKEVFVLSAVNRFLNQVGPNYAGAAARAVFFKKRYKVSFTKFSSSFAAANVIQILISCIVATCFYVLSTGDFTDIASVSSILIGTLILTIMLFIPMRPFVRLAEKLNERYDKKVLERLTLLLSEYARVRRHPGLFGKMLFWMTTLTLISGVIIFLLYLSLGQSLSLYNAIFIAAMTNLSIILSITPAGLGIREGMIVFSSSLLGVPVIISLAVSLLLRAATIATTGIISLVYFKRLT